MGDKTTVRDDEYDVNFSDTREFVKNKWDDAVLSVQQTQTSADWEKIIEERDWLHVHNDIRKRGAEPGTSPTTKRLLNHLLPLPRTLYTLIGIFVSGIKPLESEYNVLWGLLSLNIKLSCTSTEKLARTADWMRKLRSVVELFNRCLDVCEDMNEARYAMVDMLEFMLQILGDSLKHLRHCPTDREATNEYKSLSAKIKDNLAEMEEVSKHLNEITSYSKANQKRLVDNLSLRHGPPVIPEEHCSFPVDTIPRRRNEDFYGRLDELARINHYLDYSTDNNLRTYTIYGRRGVGKTDLALEYTYTNPPGFEAIFWIACETSLSLRQSFTDAAVKLNLPGADRDGHHEENQLNVQKWLKTTKRRWLLVFDNAERESILRGYWPVGVSGSILITSRKYYNFMNDATRKGDTVKPFNEEQSWDLLMKLLGPDWQDLDRRGVIIASEDRAAKELLKSVGGLALAIVQAAQLIKNDKIGGSSIASTYESFRKHKRDLPPRLSGDRHEIVHSLDSLWNMTFTNLTRNARDLLSVLSLLSPDGIIIDLFLPKNQSALDGKLRFCRQHPNHIDPASQAALSSVIRAPPALQDAIAELVKFKLIKQEGRELWAHRVVQEAMNYHSNQDLQEYFDSACAIVYEAFPKQTHGNYLSKEEQIKSQSYIPHGAHLSFQYFSLYRTKPSNLLKGSINFIDLLSNSAWYLYEVSDYDLCLRLVETAWIACAGQTETIRYANLCNIAGGAYFELNRLEDCRKVWEIWLSIMQAKLLEDDPERSHLYHNMGNLETAVYPGIDNLDTATDYFKRAIAIRTEVGDSAASLLANSYLCRSRVHYLRGAHEEAINLLNQSEALYSRTSGADAQFMAHVHYAYGNNQFAQKRWVSAKRSYQTSLRIGLMHTPIHPITAAAYYSLGCVAFELKNHDHAKDYLDKALTIAQLRSPNRTDGTMARIMWKKSVVLEDDTVGAFANEAYNLRTAAELARRDLTGKGEGGLVFAIDEHGNVDANETEDSYDALVPVFFR